MIIRVSYCKHVRKDGSINEVIFDTGKRVLLNENSLHENYTFVEAQQSRDVNALREALIKDGYDHTFLKG